MSQEGKIYFLYHLVPFSELVQNVFSENGKLFS